MPCSPEATRDRSRSADLARLAARWRAPMLAIVAVGVLLWHMLACVEGPMSFAPNGDLVLVTATPIVSGEEDDDILRSGDRVYRLFVLPRGREKVRLVEKTREHMLGPPAFRPDGKELCYLRVALLPPKPKKLTRGAGPDVKAEKPDPPHSGLKAWLEIRSGDSFEKTAEVGLDLGDLPHKEARNWLFSAYIAAQPQYAPDGGTVYLPLRDSICAVRPADKTLRRIDTAKPPISLRLSPDGKTLAATEADGIEIFNLDEEPSRGKPLDKKALFNAVAWLDSRTLALASQESKKAPLKLMLVRADGSVVLSKTVPIPRPPGEKPDDKDEGHWEEIAASPDGKHVVIVNDDGVAFMTSDGEVLRVASHAHFVPEEEGVVLQPCFTPDSKQVAFKLFRDEDEAVARLVFFTADGHQLVRKAALPGSVKAKAPKAKK